MNYKKSLLIGLLVFVSVLILTQFLSYQRYVISKNAEQQKVLNEINSVKYRLKTALGHSLSATKTLAFIVGEYGVPKDFNKVAGEILAANKYIDALELTREGTITHIYPLKGNEDATGYNVLEDPLRNSEARNSHRKKRTLLCRSIGAQTGWSSCGWLEAAGIDESQDTEFSYQLSKINPATLKEEFFLKGSIPENKGGFVSIEVPDGEWKFYLWPKHQHGFLFNILFSVLGVLLSLTGGALAWYLARQPQNLQKLVKLKTNQIEAEKRLSESIINGLPGIFYLYDKSLRFKRWNKNFEIVCGYTAEEIDTLSPLDFYDEDEKSKLKEKIALVFEEGSSETTANFLTKDNRKIPYFFNGHKITFEGVDYLPRHPHRNNS